MAAQLEPVLNQFAGSAQSEFQPLPLQCPWTGTTQTSDLYFPSKIRLMPNQKATFQLFKHQNLSVLLHTGL